MKDIIYAGMKTKAVNYKGVQIVRSCLTPSWFLFFRKDGKFPSTPPFVGTLSDMKDIINTASRLGMGGEKEFIPEDTY